MVRVLVASIVVLLGVAIGAAVVKEPEEKAPVARALPAPESPAPAASPAITAPPSPTVEESPLPAETKSPAAEAMAAVEPTASPTLPRTGGGSSVAGALLVALAIAGGGFAVARRRNA
jgi:LPXTG-motif cell wall-anchored protein